MGKAAATDTGESSAEFNRLVDDYPREMRAGTVFPPLLVAEVTPAADRAALGPVFYWLATRDNPPALSCHHVVILNGRHRAMAAQALGLRTFPAYCWASLAHLSLPRGRAQWRGWAQDVLRLEAAVLDEARASRQRGIATAARSA
jgi:hypothetical protein